jgi:hypothetical protein
VNDRRDFELFCSFFEAFLGFYKYYAEKEKVSGAGHSGGNYQGRQNNQSSGVQVFRK